MIVNDAAELNALPDGTIITWLRIPGDSTSEAVAFVRHERDDRTTMGRQLTPEWVTWISPGGWDPQTPESAGINYPVVAFADPSQAEPFSHAEAALTPPLVETLDVGGSYHRLAALDAAATIKAGDAVGSRNWVGADQVLKMADTFLAWLNDEGTP